MSGSQNFLISHQISSILGFLDKYKVWPMHTVFAHIILEADLAIFVIYVPTQAFVLGSIGASQKI